MDRVIFHCDLNSFYASVELLSHPELRHLPVAVCGDPSSRHGIILAKMSPPSPLESKQRKPSGRLSGSVPIWSFSLPITVSTGIFPVK